MSACSSPFAPRKQRPFRGAKGDYDYVHKPREVSTSSTSQDDRMSVYCPTLTPAFSPRRLRLRSLCAEQYWPSPPVGTRSEVGAS
ncbi:MAG: hypothetical protein R3C01_01460 [Planctomycetaceae bacterium]